MKYFIFILIIICLTNSNLTMAAAEERTKLITNKNLVVNTKSRILNFNWDKFWVGFAEYPEGPTGSAGNASNKGYQRSCLFCF